MVDGNTTTTSSRPPSTGKSSSKSFLTDAVDGKQKSFTKQHFKKKKKKRTLRAQRCRDQQFLLVANAQLGHDAIAKHNEQSAQRKAKRRRKPIAASATHNHTVLLGTRTRRTRRHRQDFHAPSRPPVRATTKTTQPTSRRTQTPALNPKSTAKAVIMFAKKTTTIIKQHNRANQTFRSVVCA